MTDHEVVGRMLESFAERSCACGKRERGDCQKLVGNFIRKQNITFDGSGDGEVAQGCFECQVCGDRHTGRMLLPDNPVLPIIQP